MEALIVKAIPPGWNLPRADFVTTPSPQNICCHCKKGLYQPLQTSCGHKCCTPCVIELLSKNPQVMCPVNESDCEEITVNNVFQDLGTFREISRLDVYCVNRKNGCSEIAKLIQLQAHLDECQFSPIQCTVKGCQFKGTTDELAVHMTKAAPAHVTLLSDYFSNATQVLEDKVSNLAIENAMLKDQGNKMLEIKQENVNLKTAYAEMNTKFNQLGNYLMKMKERQDGFEKQLSGIQAPYKLSGTTISANEAQGTKYMNIYEWTIDNYNQRKLLEKEGKQPYLDSDPFYCGGPNGYKMAARVYLNGDGLGKGQHLSLYVSFLKGENDDRLEWPFKYRIAMVLCDQTTKNGKAIQEQFDPSPTSMSYQKPATQRGKGTGFPLFAKLTEVESPRCLRNDTIKILINVDSKVVEDVQKGANVIKEN